MASRPHSYGKTMQGLSTASSKLRAANKVIHSCRPAPALEAVQAEMLPDERVRAFLDDVYVTSHPPRVAHLLDRLQHHLFVQAHIRLNPSKTRGWNAAGVQPPALPAAPDGARLWVGDLGLPASERGLRILGTPLGTPEYIAAQLESLSTQRGTLFARLPDVPDLQVAWLLLLFCALPRAQYVLRVLPPHQTAAFAGGTPPCRVLRGVSGTQRHVRARAARHATWWPRSAQHSCAFLRSVLCVVGRRLAGHRGS